MSEKLENYLDIYTSLPRERTPNPIGRLVSYLILSYTLLANVTSVTGCCVSVRDFEELGMQTCIPGSVLLVHIARQHGWLLKSCARTYHAVITLSSHLAANQNKGVTCG